MDILAYRPVIEDVLYKLNVASSQKEDLIQEAYLTLLENQEAVEAAKNPGAFARLTVRNRIIDLWRAEGRQIPVESLDDPKIHSKVVRTPAPKSASITADMLSEAMSQLTDEEGEVVYLLHVEGYTIPQVSELVCMSSATVRRRAESGLEKLRKYFEA